MKLSAATAVTSTADTSLIYLADTDDGGSSFSTKKITKANLLNGVLSAANTSLTGTTAIGGTIKLANQGSDPSAVADSSFIFAKDADGASEVHVMDEGGNVTKISPHNSDGEWEYFSRNTKTGKTVRINMEKFIHTMEELTGETFIEYN